MLANLTQKALSPRLRGEILRSSAIINSWDNRTICTINNLPESYKDLLFSHYTKRNYRKDEWMNNVKYLAAVSFQMNYSNSQFSIGSFLSFSSTSNSKSQTSAGDKQLSFIEKTVSPDGTFDKLTYCKEIVCFAHFLINFFKQKIIISKSEQKLYLGSKRMQIFQ